MTTKVPVQTNNLTKITIKILPYQVDQVKTAKLEYQPRVKVEAQALTLRIKRMY